MKRWLHADEAAEYVGYTDAKSFDPARRRRALKAFRMWVARFGVPCGHLGRRPVFLPEDLDRVIAPAARPLRKVIG